MKLHKAQLGLLVYSVVSFVLLVPAFAQDHSGNVSADSDSASANVHLGYPQDWSSRHLVMTGNDDSATLKAGRMEPRHVYNMVMRRAAIEEARRHPKKPAKNAMKVDWSISLENGYVPATQYPAKYRFDISTESCNGDYVLFGLTVASEPQANLVGINNLYTSGSSPCDGGTPWVAFAYNTITQTAGQIRTSPALSEDGTKAAFVESATTGSYFHVMVLPNPIPVPPSKTGTVLAPATPTSCATPTVAGCMTTVQISSAANTLSSPWIDYNTDIAYVATDNGNLYKISPVFLGGAPKVVTDSNWPVAVVPAGSHYEVLTDPVVDDFENLIFIGDENGRLYSINLTSPAKKITASVPIGWVPNKGAGTGVVDPPIVVNDIANPAIDQVFAFTGCSSVGGIGGAVTQLPANFTSVADTNTTLPSTVDLGSASGRGDCTGLNVHAGNFDNQFWITGTTGGHMIACGFVDKGGISAPPQMYMYPFISGQLNNAADDANAPTTSWAADTTKGDECSPLTEFFDGASDRLFYGVGSKNAGFIKSSSITAGLPASSTCTSGAPTSTCVTAPHALGGTSGIVVDNQLSSTGGANIYFTTLAPGSVNGQSCHALGGTASPYCAVKLTQTALQ